MTFRQKLITLNACDEAVKWVGDRTLERAWAECTVPSWMTWLCRRAGLADHPGLRLAAADIAEDVWHLVPADAQLACAWAIDAARRHARGECGDDEQSAAFDTAYAAANAAHAAGLAADAAAAAFNAADAAFYAANAADAAFYAAADAADARQAQDRASCDAIWRHVSVDEVRAALGGMK